MGKNSVWFKDYFSMNIKYISWMHGIFTFSLMWLCQPQNLLGTLFANNLRFLAVLQQGMVSLLAIILWDIGNVYSSLSLTSKILINFHHIGLFVAVLLGPGWD